MYRKRLLSSTRLPLTLLAILLLLCAQAVSGTARAQEETDTLQCIQGLELPAELAELDLAGLQAALQALVAEDPEATVTLLFGGREVATVRADLLLADEAVLTALLEGQPINVTVEFSEQGELDVITAIEVSTAEDCSEQFCVEGIELPAALADLDVAGLRAALEAMVAEDADATVTLTIFGEPTDVRADLLAGLDDPVLEALLAGDLLSVTVNFQDESFVIIGIALPQGNECEGDTGGPPEPKPLPDDKQDGQQGGDGQDDQQGAPKPPAPDDKQDDQQTGTGDDQDDKQGGGDDQQDKQTGGGADTTVTKTFELTLNGDVPEADAFYVAYAETDRVGSEASILVLCGEPGFEGIMGEAACEGNGTVYTESIEVPAGTEIWFGFFRKEAADAEAERFHSGTETINADMTNTAWYTFGGGKGDDQQDDQQTGTGDDQQDDDQQVEMVTKTFEITLYGDVPADQAFYVAYTPRGARAGSVIFCGQVPGLDPLAECEGNGTVYRGTVQFPAGTVLQSSFNRIDEDTAANEPFHNTEETLDSDMTNTAWYRFGAVAKDQQDDQDDQQVEMPKALPKTGVGGMASPAFPVGNALAGASVLVAAAYTGLRRR